MSSTGRIIKGNVLLSSLDWDVINCWSSHEGYQVCPFEDIRTGEMLFSMMGSGPIACFPQDEATARRSEIQVVRRDELGLHLKYETTEDIWSQLDNCGCIRINISWDSFEPKDCLNFGLAHTLAIAEEKGLLQNPFPFQVEKLEGDPYLGFHKLFVSSTNEQGNLVFENIHVLLKITRTGCKTERSCLKRLRLMGTTLLSEGIASDFTIKVGDKKFPCHKCFLMGQSMVFARMLDTNMAEQENHTMTIEDMSAEGVEGFLKYVYTGNLEGARTNLKVCFEMLRAGHKYEMEDLEHDCKDILYESKSEMFDAATLFEIYKFSGNVEGLEPLQDKAARVFKESIGKFERTGELRTLLDSVDNRAAFAEWLVKACSVSEVLPTTNHQYAIHRFH